MACPLVWPEVAVKYPRFDARAGGKDLSRLSYLILLILTVGLVATSIAPTALAVNYTVDANPYSATHTVTSTNLYDTYELTAANGQSVAYSMTVTTTGGCAQLFFVKGHNVGPASQYYIAYSQENCVASYSNSFPVASSDGTQFTVLITTTQSTDVTYNVAVSVTTPVIPSWVIGLIVVILIVVVIAVIRTVLRRRRRAAMPPPMAPPPYPAPPPSPPGQWPPQQPPPPSP